MQQNRLNAVLKSSSVKNGCLVMAVELGRLTVEPKTDYLKVSRG